MDDKKIIELYFRRDEQAIQESMNAYSAYCHTIAAGILNDPADIEEAVANTYLAAWDAIPPHTPKYLRLFLGRIARNQAISIWRTRNAQSRGCGQAVLALEELGECVSSSGSPEQAVDAAELRHAINTFLKSQPSQQRQVFLRRYFYIEDIPAIAHRYGLRETNVRMMLSRTRKKLRKFLIQEGYIV